MRTDKTLAFPPDVTKFAGAGRIYTNNAIDRLFVEYTSPYKGFRALKTVLPFDDQFEFPVEYGCALVPSNIVGDIYLDQRGTLQRFFSKIPEGLRTYNMPIGFPLEGSAYLSPQRSKRGALMIPIHSNEALPQDVLSVPGEQINLTRLIEIVRETTYWICHVCTAGEILHSEGGDKGRIFHWLDDHFPHMRGLLGQFGTVVYEGGAPDADRLLLCLKDIHGDAVAVDQFCALGDESPDFFVHAQNDLIDIVQKILHQEGCDHVKIFLESFPAQVSQDYLEDPLVQGLMMIAGRFPSMTIVDALQRLKSGINNESSMHAILPGCIGVRERILAECAARGRTDILFGDGRFEKLRQERDKHREEHKEGISNKKVTRRGIEGLAIAGKQINAVFTDEKLFHEPHRYLTASIARELKAKQIGILVYGGYHFGAGTRIRTEDDVEFNIRYFEEYFSYLPRTRVIVMESKHLGAANQENLRIIELLGHLKPEELKEYTNVRPELERINLLYLLNLIDSSRSIPFSEIIKSRNAAITNIRKIFANKKPLVQKVRQDVHAVSTWAS